MKIAVVFLLLTGALLSRTAPHSLLLQEEDMAELQAAINQLAEIESFWSRLKNGAENALKGAHSGALGGGQIQQDGDDDDDLENLAKQQGFFSRLKTIGGSAERQGVFDVLKRVGEIAKQQGFFSKIKRVG